MSLLKPFGNLPLWRAVRTGIWPTQTFEERVGLVTGLRLDRTRTLHHLPLNHMRRQDWPVDLLVNNELREGYQARLGHVAERLASRFQWAAAQRRVDHHFTCVAPGGKFATRLVFSREDGGLSTSIDLVRHLGWVAADVVRHGFANVVQDLEAVVGDGHPDPLVAPALDGYEHQK